MVELKRTLSNDTDAIPSSSSSTANVPLKIAKQAKAIARSRSIERVAPPPAAASSDDTAKLERKHHPRRPRATQSSSAAVPDGGDGSNSSAAKKEKKNNRARTSVATSVTAADYAPRRPRSRAPVSATAATPVAVATVSVASTADEVIVAK